MPAAARAHTERGAEAFVRFYYASVAHAYKVRDTHRLEALALPSCIGCGVFVRAITKLKALGHHVDEDVLVVENVAALPADAPGEPVFDVGAREPATKTIDSAGRVVNVAKPGVISFRTTVIWQSGSWKIAKVFVQ